MLEGAYTVYDFVLLGIMLFFLVRGIWIGFIRQVSFFVALYLGYFVSSQYYQELYPFWKSISQNPKVIFLGSYAILFVVTYIVILLLGKGLQRVTELSFTSWFDRLLGAFVGAAKGALVIVLLHMVLGTLLAPENKMLRSCASCKIVSSAADSLRLAINDSSVQEALRANKPAISLDTVKEYLEPITSKK